MPDRKPTWLIAPRCSNRVVVALYASTLGPLAPLGESTTTAIPSAFWTVDRRWASVRAASCGVGVRSALGICGSSPRSAAVCSASQREGTDTAPVTLAAATT